MELSGYQIYGIISEVDKEEFQNILNQNNILEVNEALLRIRNGGGCGLMHYVAQTNKGDELFEYVVNKLSTLTEPQIASIIWKKDDSGARPVHWAAERNPRILEAIITKFLQFYQYEYNEMIDEPTPINVRDSKNETPLYYAALEGQQECVEILLRNRADANAQNDSGASPLHVATLNRHREIIGLLIDYRADINLKDKFGKSPLETAEYLKDESLLAFFNPEERRKQERLDNLSRENQSLSNQILILQQNNKRLEDKIVEVLKNMFNVEQKLKAQSEVSDQAIAECKRLGDVNETLRNERQALSEKLVEAEGQVVTLRENLDSATRLLDEKSDIVQHLENQIKSGAIPVTAVPVSEEHALTSKSDEEMQDSQPIEPSPAAPLDLTSRSFDYNLIVSLKNCFSTIQKATELTNSSIAQTLSQFDELLSRSQ